MDDFIAEAMALPDLSGADDGSLDVRLHKYVPVLYYSVISGLALAALTFWILGA